jgi:pimeloyl-ACP methyl ester carboxylesterase
VIGPLTDPTAHGGSAEDAFDLVLPSLPGYGFSGKPTGTGWTPDRIARAWHELMRRLGYGRYVAQCGASVVSDAMGRQAPDGLLGIHVNMSATVPPEIARALTNGEPAPAGLTEREKVAYAGMDALYKQGSGCAGIMLTRPETLGYSLADSPVGLAAWFYDEFADWTYSGGDPERSLTRDEMLDDVTLHWLTNTGTSGARLYMGEQRQQLQRRGRLDPGRDHGLPRRDLPDAPQLGRACLSPAHLPQRGRQGRPLRGVGTAGALRHRGPRRVQIAALVGARGRRA